MVIHQTANIVGYRHCGGGDITFLVVEEHNSTCPTFNPSLLFISKGHGLKAHDISFLKMQHWSHAPKAEVEEKYINNFWHSVQKGGL